MDGSAETQPQTEQPTPELNNRVRELDRQHLSRLQENPYGFVRETSEKVARLELQAGQQNTEIARLQEENERLRKEKEQLSQENEELKREQEKLTPLARKDALTGLGNRLSFDEKLLEAIATAISTEQDLSLLFFDFDDFKSINDTFGHQYGDEALKATAVALKAELHRLTDTAFRFGGDEFAVLLPRTDKIGSIKVALRLLERVNDLEIVVNGHTIKVAISTGVDTYKPPSKREDARYVKDITPRSASDLFKGADIATAAAKQKRNQVGFIYDSEEEKFNIGQEFRDQREKLTPHWREAGHPEIKSNRK